MDTFIAPATLRHTRLRIPTGRPTQFVDLTDQLRQFVAESQCDFGIVNVQSLHTTTALVLNEHEPLLLEDFAGLLERAAPAGIAYRHDNFEVRTVNLTPGESINGHAHCRALILSPSVSLNVVGGELQLGRWQRLFLVELDGPRTRDLSVLLVGDATR